MKLKNIGKFLLETVFSFSVEDELSKVKELQNSLNELVSEHSISQKKHDLLLKGLDSKIEKGDSFLIQPRERVNLEYEESINDYLHKVSQLRSEIKKSEFLLSFFDDLKKVDITQQIPVEVKVDSHQGGVLTVDKEEKEKSQFSDVIVFNEKFQILLLKRKKTCSFEPFKWCLPGGHVEEGDSFLKTAVKELSEESGIVVDESNLLKVFEYRKDSVKINYYSLYLKETPTVTLLECEHENYIWCDLDQLDKYDLIMNLSDNLKLIYPSLNSEVLSEEDYLEVLSAIPELVDSVDTLLVKKNILSLIKSKEKGKIFYQKPESFLKKFLTVLVQLSSKDQKKFLEYQLEKSKEVKITEIEVVYKKYPEVRKQLENFELSIDNVINSTIFALKFNYKYIEGYALKSGFPIQYSWNKIHEFYIDLNEISQKSLFPEYLLVAEVKPKILLEGLSKMKKYGDIVSFLYQNSSKTNSVIEKSETKKDSEDLLKKFSTHDLDGVKVINPDSIFKNPFEKKTREDLDQYFEKEFNVKDIEALSPDEEEQLWDSGISKIKKVKVKNIIPSQNYVKYDDLIHHLEHVDKGKHPLGLTIPNSNKIVLFNGHHRTSSAILRGKKKIKLRLRPGTDLFLEYQKDQLKKSEDLDIEKGRKALPVGTKNNYEEIKQEDGTWTKPTVPISLKQNQKTLDLFGSTFEVDKLVKEDSGLVKYVVYVSASNPGVAYLYYPTTKKWYLDKTNIEENPLSKRTDLYPKRIAFESKEYKILENLYSLQTTEDIVDVKQKGNRVITYKFVSEDQPSQKYQEFKIDSKGNFELVTDFLSTENELEKGEKASIGEIREWKGEKYEKTPQGWVPVKKEKTSNTEIDTQKFAKKTSSEQLDKFIKTSDNEGLKKVAKEELESRTSLPNKEALDNLRKEFEEALSSNDIQKMTEIGGKLTQLSSQQQNKETQITKTEKEVSVDKEESRYNKSKEKFKKSLSEEESEVLSNYLEDSSKINTDLREDKKKSVAKEVQVLDSLFEKPEAKTKKDLYVYRVVSLSGYNENLSKLKKGDDFSDLGYTSTTASSRALKFIEAAYRQSGDKIVNMRIKIPKGSSIVPVDSSVEDQVAQFEYLLKRNSSFKVIDSHPRGLELELNLDKDER